MRNLDFGTSDGLISPCLPGVAECPNPNPFLVPVPSPNVLTMNGFRIIPKITGNSKGMKGIKGIIRKDYVTPPVDFPIIERYLKEDAIRKGDRYCQ